MATPASRAFLRIIELWQLTDEEGAALLGSGISKAALASWRTEAPGVIDQAVLLRISLVLGAYEALERAFRRQPERHIEWLRLARDDEPFHGQAPMAFALEGGHDALVGLRQYLDALNGGPPMR